MTTQRCDNRSVGVLAERNDRYLMITRARFPVGVAPVAGHVDQHPTGEACAVAEMREETGLDVQDLRPVVNWWLPNRCRRPTGQVGHMWQVYAATVAGTLNPSAEEASAVGWYALDEIKELAGRTVAYATSRLPEQEWQASPGLEPVWCQLLTKILRPRLLTLSAGELAAVAHLAAGGSPPAGVGR